MVCGGLRWFVVVCGGLWWIAVVCLLVIPNFLTVTCLTSALLFKGTAWFNIALIGAPLTVSCYSNCETIVVIAG